MDDNAEFLEFIGTLLLVCLGAFFIHEIFSVAYITLTWMVFAIVIGPVSWRFSLSSFKSTWPFFLAFIWLAFWPTIDQWHYSSTLDPLSPWHDYAKPVLLAKGLLEWGLLFAVMASGMYVNRLCLENLRDWLQDRF